MARKKRHRIFTAVFVFLGILAGLLAAEALMRAFSARLEKHNPMPSEIDFFYTGNIVKEKIRLIALAYPSQYDPLTGHIPREGYNGKNNIWSEQVTIGENGIRSNGPDEGGKNPPILALGDSFVFGDEVSDGQTWPAHLEKETGIRVLNAGVFGFGLDQTFLRTLKMNEVFRPRVFLVGVIPDDIPRICLKTRTGVEKPWLSVEGGKLKTHNLPPPPGRPRVGDVGLFREIFGYSYLVDFFMRRFGDLNQWYAGAWKTERVDNKPMEVAEAVVDHLAQLQEYNGIPVVLVAQYLKHDVADPGQEARKLLLPLLKRARQKGLWVLDFYPMLAQKARNAGGLDPLYGQWHHTDEGNRYIAGEIARFLENNNLLEPPERPTP